MQTKNIRNKLLAILLVIMVAMAYSVPAFADDGGSDQGGDKATKVEEPKSEPAKEDKPEKEEKPAAEEKESKDAEETKDTPESSDAQKQEESTDATSDQGADKGSDSDAAKDANDKAAEASDKNAKGNAKTASTGNATYIAVNNSTSLVNGEYAAGSFNYSGGTGKVTLSCDKIIVTGGKARAVIRSSSKNFSHFFTGKIDTDKNGDDENKDLYDPSTGKKGTGVYATKQDSNGSYATVPVSLGVEMKLAGRSTAMTEPHWIQYAIIVTAKAQDRTGDAEIQDGTYKPDSFTFTGGTGKATMTCDRVVVSDGKATAILKASSANMTHLYMGKASSNDETPSLYDPDKNTCGNNVYPISNQTVAVPVQMNQDGDCAARTTAMSAPHWINYTYHLTLTADSELISDSTDIPENGGNPTDPTNPTDPADPTNPTGPTDPTNPTDPDAPSTTQKLSAGTWKVKATTDRVMFYLNPKETDPAWVILNVASNGSMTATITLSGDGYDYVYMGTPAQAKAAGKSKWIPAKVSNGYYSFTVPVSALDQRLAISPHSRKYESDGDVTTEPWRPNKWIIFYSGGAVKVKDGTSLTPTTKKSDTSSKTSGTQTKFKNDGKKDKVSKWKDDAGKSTSAVDNSTSLKDGVYTPDRFSWSGGSGRLAYIRCNKITVRGGKAYATIEFSSPHYDSLKANGRVYSKQGGGNSKFVIPVKLNTNNTIIGRTTAMSQPHWVKYTIFIYKAGATAGKKDTAAGTDGHVTNTDKLTDKAPDLLGLKSAGKVDVKYARYFRIFKYERGITLISVDQGTDTALYKESANSEQSQSEQTDGSDQGTDETTDQGEDSTTGSAPVVSDVLVNADGSASAAVATVMTRKNVKASAADASSLSGETASRMAEADAAGATAEDAALSEGAQDTQAAGNQPKVEYDEEGKPIAKTDSEVTADLYGNNVVNYLIVPKGAELPAGLEKDCVIIEQPEKKAFVASEDFLTELDQLGLLEVVDSVGIKEANIENENVRKAVKDGDITAMNSYEKPDFRHLVKSKTDLAVLPEKALPEKVTEETTAEQKELSKQKTQTLQKLQSRFAALNVPLMVNRAAGEKDSFAKAEWILVCGAIFGEEEKAQKLFDQYTKDNKKEAIDNE